MAFIHPYIFAYIYYIYISYLAAASLNVSLRLKEIQTRCIQLTCTPSLPQRHNKRFSRMYM